MANASVLFGSAYRAGANKFIFWRKPFVLSCTFINLPQSKEYYEKPAVDVGKFSTDKIGVHFSSHLPYGSGQHDIPFRPSMYSPTSETLWSIRTHSSLCRTQEATSMLHYKLLVAKGAYYVWSTACEMKSVWLRSCPRIQTLQNMTSE